MLRRVRELLGGAKHNSRGEETPDPQPMEIPVHAKRPESLQEMIARLVVAQDFKRAIMNREFETLEEATDFDIEGDDPEETFSAHEKLAMEMEVPDGGREAIERARHARESRGREDSRREDSKSTRYDRGVRRDEPSAGDDDDGRARSRRGGEDQESRRRGDRDRARDRRDGDGGAD